MEVYYKKSQSVDYVKSTNSGNSFRTVVVRSPANEAPL